jgi:energy-coupling factor transport system ATP-binding protein
VQLLLLDELTTFLDVEDAESVLEAVRGVISEARGVAAVWVTHRLEELPHADRVTYMEEGKVQRSGSPAQILRHLRSLGACT